MAIQQLAKQLITNTFANNSKVKAFSDDFIGGFIDWISPLFLKEDEKLLQQLRENAQADKTQNRLEVRLEDMLEDDSFRNELEQWIRKYQSQQPRLKNIVEDSDLDIKRNLHIGNKGSASGQDQFDQSNIIRGSSIKAGGDFHLGDIGQSNQAVNNIEKQININKNEGAILDAAARSTGGQTTDFTNGYALLIGVGGDLPGAAKDAQSLNGVLTNPTMAAYPVDQVNLLVGAKATREHILEAFDQLIEKVDKDPDATVIIHYSGHGGIYPEDQQEQDAYYLLPYDYVQNKSKKNLLSGKVVAEKIDRLKARKLLVLFDCCHAQGITSRDEVAIGARFKRSSSPFIEMLSKGEGKVVIASCKDDELSWETAGSGIFTTALLEALKGCNSEGKQGYVNVLDILQYVLVTVPERCRQLGKKQNPVISEIQNLDAEFYVCQYNSSIALQAKSEAQLPATALAELTQTPQQTVQNYAHVKNQVNIETNHGPINLS